MTERTAQRGKITRIEIPEDLAAEVANLYAVAMDKFKRMGLAKIEETVGDDPFDSKTKVSLEGSAEAVAVFNTMWDYSHALMEMCDETTRKKITPVRFTRQAMNDVLGAKELDIAANEGITVKGGTIRIGGGVAGNQTVNRTVNGDDGVETITSSGFIELQSGKKIVLRKFSEAVWGPRVHVEAIVAEASDGEIKPGVRLMRRVLVKNDDTRVMRLVLYEVVDADKVVEDLKRIDVAKWL